MGQIYFGDTEAKWVSFQSALTTELPDDLEKLKQRQITPGRFFFETCDGKFTDEDLDEPGNAFAREYFNLQGGAYLRDYTETLCHGLPTPYHVPDTWESFERLKPVLDRRFTEWKNKADRPK